MDEDFPIYHTMTNNDIIQEIQDEMGLNCPEQEEDHEDKEDNEQGHEPEPPSAHATFNAIALLSSRLAHRGFSQFPLVNELETPVSDTISNNLTQAGQDKYF